VEGEEIGVFLEGALAQATLLPQVGGEVGVGLSDSEEGGLHEVTHSLRATLGLGVNIVDTGELENLLGHLGGDDTSSAGGRDEAHGHGTALSGNLHWYCVRVTDHVTPISTTHGDDSELGEDDGTTNGCGYLLRALDTQADMPIRVTNNDEGLEACPLTGAGLLLHGHDFHHLILQLSFHEEVYDLVLLDWEGEKVDLLQALDESFLY